MADNKPFNKDLRYANFPWAQYNVRQPQQVLAGRPPVKSAPNEGFEFLVGPNGEGAPWPIEHVRETYSERGEKDGVGIPLQITTNRFDVSGSPPAFEYDSATGQMTPVELPPMDSWFNAASREQSTPQGQFVARLMEEKLSMEPEGDAPADLDPRKALGPKMTPASWASGKEYEEAMLTPAQLKARKKREAREKQIEAQMRMMLESTEKRLKKRGYTQEKPLPK